MREEKEGRGDGPCVELGAAVRLTGRLLFLPGAAVRLTGSLLFIPVKQPLRLPSRRNALST